MLSNDFWPFTTRFLLFQFCLCRITATGPPCFSSLMRAPNPQPNLHSPVWVGRNETDQTHPNVASHLGKTSHIGTNTPKFVASRWGWPPFDILKPGCANLVVGLELAFQVDLGHLYPFFESIWIAWVLLSWQVVLPCQQTLLAYLRKP